ncbi:MAG: PD40 domain-containing protein, partial [Candidatus Eremiobacteraeota bacterium]|nr:PD40 domain-containing protein [Candidatus Eremiobacteraeota bacterium]
YSQDMTEGQTFEYNKDSTGEIYVIRRLERSTGNNERFITGPGGSVRPTPSPDGKWIAFVRRVRANTVLFVKDLESGRETPLYDGLERDMQETWAIHGVYPSMAWTPDSRQIVFYAGGGFHRIPVGGGTVADIPFHLKTTRQVQQALRFPVEVAPEQFQVKAIRWPTVAPDGKKVVFQALGYLWLQDLPDGKPRRLTNQTEHFEFYPSFSRDGKSIVYTTWSDANTGSVRVSDLEGHSRVLVEHGQFITPVFSPDGQVVVYEKLNADNLLSRLYAMDTGLFKVAVAGGQPEKLVTQASNPHFGTDPKRVYFVRGGQRVALRSILLDGSKEREHFDGGSLVTDIRISPDGKHLAFSQDFRWFQVPYVDSGLVAEVSETTKALPVDALTAHSADYVHWTNGGSRIHWALGPRLYSRATSGGPVEEVSLSFPWPTDKPEGQVAVVGGKVITMEGDTIY